MDTGTETDTDTVKDMKKDMGTDMAMGMNMDLITGNGMDNNDTGIGIFCKDCHVITCVMTS